MTFTRPSPLATWRHCPDPDCAVSWFDTEPACWACGTTGRPGQLTAKTSRPYETYTGSAPTDSSGRTAR